MQLFSCAPCVRVALAAVAHRGRSACTALTSPSCRLLRSAVASGSALGKEVQACQESGVIPDDLLTKVVLTALASDSRFVERGWLLDGFPRTLAQVGDIGPYVHMAAAG